MKKKKKRSGTLARRWSLRVVSMTGVFLLLFLVVVTVLTYCVVDRSSREIISGKASVIASQTAQTTDGALQKAIDVVKGYTATDGEIVAVLDPTGDVVATSGGAESALPTGDDLSKALESSDHIGYWRGTLESGKPALAGTTLLYNSEGKLVGSLRIVYPLSSGLKIVFWVCLSMVIGGMALLLCVILVSNTFVRRLVSPIKEINFTANKIAQGDFTIRLEKRKDDEIGTLCDAINDMAVSLSATENMKNEFISSISHELRTPLTAIKGWAETMQCSMNDEEMLDRGLTVIVRESERLSGIVEELLDFSRMQSGKMKTDMKKDDLLEDLGESVDLFADRAKAEGKFLLYDPPRWLPPVYGDRNRLRQVFVNIIDNALKYTDEGGTVNVSAKTMDGYLYITVADNGCGIPAEHLPNVKRKFYKANQTIRGSGIGLALADEIMELHGGRLDIESHENLGTAVTLSLPTYETLQKQRKRLG